jgi:hypothetical protein
MKRYLQIYMVLLLSILTTNIIKAQKFEHIKQIYNDDFSSMVIDRILELKGNKFVVVDCRNTKGNIFYGEELIDESPGVNVKRYGFLLIKIDKSNNYLDHKFLEDYYDPNVEYAPAGDYFHISNDKIYFSIQKLQVSYRFTIIGIDENFNEKIRIPTKGLQFPEFAVKDDYLYLNTKVTNNNEPIIIESDTLNIVNGYRWLIKWSLLDRKVVYATRMNVDQVAAFEPSQINENGELYLAGKFGYLFKSYLTIGNDSIYNPNGNNDGCFIKLDKDGNVIFIRHLKGAGTERFGSFILEGDGTAYFITTIRQSDDSNLGGQSVNCSLDKNYFNILRIDNSGKILWQLPIENLSYLPPFMIDLDEEFLLLSTNYKEEISIGETVFSAQDNFNSLIFKLNKNTGDFEILRTLTGFYQQNQRCSFVTDNNKNFLSTGMSLSNLSKDDIIFDDYVLKVSGDINQTWVQIVANLNLNLPVSTSEYQKETKVLIYPNPVFKEQVVKIVSDDKIKNVSVIDLLGQIVESYHNENENYELFIQSNIPGIYFLKIESETQEYLKKIIIH